MSELISICGTSNVKRWGDVVFVHGLNGDARATWQPEDQPSRFWPSWLCEDLPNIGVWSVGYPVSSFGWKGSTMPLADRAISTLVLLETYGVGQEKPVIFITHSLGGLLVKEMLRKATDNSVPEGQQLAAHIRGVVFLSTPHSGSDLANFVAFLKFLLPTVSVDELRPQEPRLRELNTWYRNNVVRLGIETQVYRESKPTKAGQGWFKGRFEAMVVDANSSDPGITGVTAVPLDEDHISIGHPVRDGVLYRRIKEFVSKGLSGNTKKSEAATASTTSEENPGTVSQRDQSILKGADSEATSENTPSHPLVLPESAQKMDLGSTPPKVFISYSHDSEEHKDRVLALANRLREDGIDCTIDQYEESPAEGWQRWMLNQVEVSNFVLVVCTEQYDRRFRGHEEVSKGKGVTWEGGVIIQELYDTQGQNSKFIPIIFTREDANFIPGPLRSTTNYRLNTEDGYELLYRRLTNQPRTRKPYLGILRTLEPRERKQVFQEDPLQSTDVNIESNNQRVNKGNNIVTGAQQPKPREQGSTSIKPDFNLSALGAGTLRKIERIQREIAQLEEDHKFIEEAWSLELDPATKNRLEKSLETIENLLDEKTKQIERIKSG